MNIPHSEEIGNILARLVIADEEFTQTLIDAVRHAGDNMLEDDVEKLENWLRAMKGLRCVLGNEK